MSILIVEFLILQQVSVQINLEFPCELSSLYEIWDPYTKKINGDVTDALKLGSLSQKFGTLQNSSLYTNTFNDSQIQLFGYNIVTGRSIIINKEQDSKGSTCSTLERGYSSKDARENKAIVSFHHPLGYAYGTLYSKD